MIKAFKSHRGRKQVTDATADATTDREKHQTTVNNVSKLNILIKEAVGEEVSKECTETLDSKELKQTVGKAMREAVPERVAEMLNEATEV